MSSKQQSDHRGGESRFDFDDRSPGVWRHFPFLAHFHLWWQAGRKSREDHHHHHHVEDNHDHSDDNHDFSEDIDDL